MKELQQKNVQGKGLLSAFYLILCLLLWFYLNTLLGKELSSYFSLPSMFNRIFREMVLPYALCFPLVFLLLWKMPKKRLTEEKKVDGKGFFRYFVVQTGLSIPVLLAATMITMIVKQHFHQEEVSLLSQNLPYLIFLLLVFNPLVEEFIFRKVFLERLLPYGRVFAMLSSAVIFALPHGLSSGMSRLLYSFILGVFWAEISMKTGKIYPAILLHALSNFWGFFLPEIMMSTGLGIGPYIVLSAIFMPIAALWIILKKGRKGTCSSEK